MVECVNILELNSLVGWGHHHYQRSRLVGGLEGANSYGTSYCVFSGMTLDDTRLDWEWHGMAWVRYG